MTNQIEKQIDLKAPVSRVWRAITDHREFGQWFKVNFEGPFALGEVARGNMTHPGYEHMRLEVVVKAFRMDDHGWTLQIKNIEKHVTGNA